MDRGDAAAERQRRLVRCQPVTSLLRRQSATMASLLPNCFLDPVHLIERDRLDHIISVSVLLWRGEFLVSTAYRH